MPFWSSTGHARVQQHDEDELEAAFDSPDDDDARSLPNSLSLRDLHPESSNAPPRYDFEQTPFSGSGGPPLQAISQPTSTPNIANRLARFIPSSLQRYTPLASSEDHHRGAIGGGSSNDGVFSNMTVKPRSRRMPGSDGVDIVGGDDENEEKEIPPSYEAAAADATPPYWENTILAPSGYLSQDETLVDGLPVGNIFGFAWNCLVSMSFQFVGFLLTYLLHTTHAAKNGSRAGLGITLIQYGFYLRDRTLLIPDASSNTTAGGDWDFWGPTIDDTKTEWSEGGNTTAPMPNDTVAELSTTDQWFSFALMLVGWFLLIGAVINYYRVSRYASALRGGNALPSSTPREDI